VKETKDEVLLNLKKFLIILLAISLFGVFIYEGIPESISLFYDEVECGKQIDGYPYIYISENGENAIAKLFGKIPAKQVKLNVYERKTISPGGEAFGIKFHTDGVIVVGLTSVTDKDGAHTPAKECGIERGDVIIEINGTKIKNAVHFRELIEQAKDDVITLRVKRGDVENAIAIKRYRSIEDNRYKLGIWVRDSTAGIGTVTFIDKESGVFGGLGHSISDVDTSIIMPLGDASIVDVNITSVKKGRNNSPGELRGTFSPIKTGELYKNTPFGVFGQLTNTKNYSDEIPIGLKNEARTGKAYIRCSIDHEGVKEYEIEILKINAKALEGKNFLIKVTDSSLIEKTGGIVQGMSGSPIIQDGKLIGAVTHVLVGDPLKGYGIFIEKMLDEIE